MWKTESWKELLIIENPFLNMERNISGGLITSYQQIPPDAFSWHGRVLIPEERLFSMVLPFLSEQLYRAKSAIPAIYSSSIYELFATIPVPCLRKTYTERLPVI
jgi:hypothetical protein